MITKYSFDSKNSGKKVLILGSIHGDEHCGSTGIEILREQLTKNELILKNGSITCIPYANFEAYHKNARQIENNLNRVFGAEGNSKEEQIAKYIQQEIETHDFILDLHSFSSGKSPFVFHDIPNNSVVDTVIRNLPIDFVMTGWTELYDNVELDTIGYAKVQNKDGMIIECGLHTDPYAVSSAYSYILSTLTTLGLITTPNFKSEKQKWIHIDTIVRKTETDSKFINKWNNLDPVKKGEIIGNINKNKTLTAPYDGYIILPDDNALVGAEWCYFGKEI